MPRLGGEVTGSIPVRRSKGPIQRMTESLSRNDTQILEASHRFAKKYPHYIPQLSTLSDPEILALSMRDTHSFSAIGNILDEASISQKKVDSKGLVLGTGSGALTEYLGDRFTNITFVDLDIAFAPIKQILQSERASKRPFLLCADASHVPMASNSVDVIVAHGVFRYIREIP